MPDAWVGDSDCQLGMTLAPPGVVLVAAVTDCHTLDGDLDDPVSSMEIAACN